MKRNLISTACICLCVFFLIFPCAAMMGDYYDYECSNVSEYKKLMRDDPPPEAFVRYDHLEFLGKLQHFSAYEGYKKYAYTLLTEDGERLYATFNTYPFDWYGELVPALPYEELVDAENLMLADTDGIQKRLGIDLDSDFHLYYIFMEIGDAVYYYSNTGKLICIQLNYNGEKCVIKTNFGKCDPESLVGRLLMRDTAKDAIAEFEARFTGTYEEVWKMPLTVAVVLCAAAVGALAAFLFLRKRAKNSPRFGGNDENLSSVRDMIAPADGDVPNVGDTVTHSSPNAVGDVPPADGPNSGDRLSSG